MVLNRRRAVLLPTLFFAGARGGVVGLLLSLPAVQLLRDWHVGCERIRQDWACPDGVAYAVPVLLLVVGCGALALLAQLVLLSRTLSREDRRETFRDLAFVGAAPLVAQAPVTVLTAAVGSTSNDAAVLSLGVGVAGCAAFAAPHLSPLLRVGGCLLAAGAACAAAPTAALAAPLLLLSATLLVGAALVIALPSRTGKVLPSGRSST